MIYLPNLMLVSGLDLNVESQTVGFLRAFAPNCHAPRQARICATHALSATEHVSALRGRPPRRAQGQGLLVPGPVLCDGFRPIDVSRVAARYRGQLASASASAVPHGFSLPDNFAQYAGQCKRDSAMAYLCRLRAPLDWRRTATARRWEKRESTG